MATLVLDTPRFVVIISFVHVSEKPETQKQSEVQGVVHAQKDKSDHD